MCNYPYLRNLKQVYIAVTNKCNLSCGYCYAIERRFRPQFFSFASFKQIVDGICSYSISKHIEIIFHGGEPLLAKYAFFEECLRYAQKRMEESGKKVDFGIQTNLTLMTFELLDLFQKYSVSISSSIDGPEPIHNSARQDWKKTKEWFMEIHNRGMKISPIIVCSKHNCTHINDIFQLFDQMGIRHIQVNIATSNTTLIEKSLFTPLSSSEILEVFKNIMGCCYKYKIREEKMHNMLKRYMGMSPHYMTTLGCENPFCHAGSSMIVFTSDGDMFPCSPCVSLAMNGVDYKLGKYGEEMSQDTYYDRLSKFHQKSKRYLSECPKCPAKKICEFDCPGFDKIDNVTRINKCKAFKDFYFWLDSQDREIIKSVIECR